MSRIRQRKVASASALIYSERIHRRRTFQSERHSNPNASLFASLFAGRPCVSSIYPVHTSSPTRATCGDPLQSQPKRRILNRLEKRVCIRCCVLRNSSDSIHQTVPIQSALLRPAKRSAKFLQSARFRSTCVPAVRLCVCVCVCAGNPS